MLLHVVLFCFLLVLVVMWQRRNLYQHAYYLLMICFVVYMNFKDILLAVALNSSSFLFCLSTSGNSWVRWKNGNQNY